MSSSYTSRYNLSLLGSELIEVVGGPLSEPWQQEHLGQQVGSKMVMRKATEKATLFDFLQVERISHRNGVGMLHASE